MPININQQLAKQFEFKSFAEFELQAKGLYSDVYNVQSNALKNIILELLSGIDWKVYKEERKVLNPNYSTKD